MTMKPILTAGLMVLALMLGCAVLGLVLVRLRKINLHNAALYCRISTLLVLAGAYALNQAEWVGLHLRQLDFWSLVVILGISSYALIWAGIAHQINRARATAYEDSIMLSVLSADSAQAWPETQRDTDRRNKD
jgi:Na+/H+ antiporter NhaC